MEVVAEPEEGGRFDRPHLHAGIGLAAFHLEKHTELFGGNEKAVAVAVDAKDFRVPPRPVNWIRQKGPDALWIRLYLDGFPEVQAGSSGERPPGKVNVKGRRKTISEMRGSSWQDCFLLN